MLSVMLMQSGMIAVLNGELLEVFGLKVRVVLRWV